MNRLRRRPGDVVYVPAGAAPRHRPGRDAHRVAGADVVLDARRALAFGLDDDQATLGLGWERRHRRFDRGGHGRRLDEVLLPAAAGSSRWRCRAPTLPPSACRRLLPRRARQLRGALALGDAGFAVLVVAGGRGDLHWDGGVARRRRRDVGGAARRRPAAARRRRRRAGLPAAPALTPRGRAPAAGRRAAAPMTLAALPRALPGQLALRAAPSGSGATSPGRPPRATSPSGRSAPRRSSGGAAAAARGPRTALASTRRIAGWWYTGYAWSPGLK